MTTKATPQGGKPLAPDVCYLACGEPEMNIKLIVLITTGSKNEKIGKAS